MARGKLFAPYIGQIKTARQLIRHRNIMLGLPLIHLQIALIPYGWEVDPDKEGWLRPVQKQLEALYMARVQQRYSTLKTLATWLGKETGRSITPDSLRIIFRTRPPLSTYLLPLDDRIRIATAQTEEEARTLQPQGIEWHRRKNHKHRTEYITRRAAAVAEIERRRRDKRKESLIQAQSRPADPLLRG